ncbi:hypothetical protein ABER98_18825 [Domibacillus aminovorans]|uniref:hypothetical protein n=1 Tax=Domibacillus aminovorans TaxID=29332 RepID=UPI003D19AA09
MYNKNKAAINFDFIYPLVEEMYSLDNGRPSVDPVILIRFAELSFSMNSIS